MSNFYCTYMRGYKNTFGHQWLYNNCCGKNKTTAAPIFDIQFLIVGNNIGLLLNNPDDCRDGLLDELHGVPRLLVTTTLLLT